MTYSVIFRINIKIVNERYIHFFKYKFDSMKHVISKNAKEAHSAHGTKM